MRKAGYVSLFPANQLSLAGSLGRRKIRCGILQRRSEDARHELAFISPRYGDHVEMEYPERHDGGILPFRGELICPLSRAREARFTRLVFY